MKRIKHSKTFEVNRNLTIRCDWIKTSYGFKHEATLLNRYGDELDTVKCTYYNRTWESYEFESVLRKLLKKTDQLNPYQKGLLKKFIKNPNRVEDELRPFKAISSVVKLGEVFHADNLKEKNEWKKRMLKAGLEAKGLTFPDNWDELTEAEKERRLDTTIDELGGD